MNEQQRIIATGLYDSISKNMDFTDSGVITDDVIFVYSQDVSKSMEVLGGFGSMDVNLVNEKCVKSCYGNMKNMTTEYDENIRLSKEIDMSDLYILRGKEFDHVIPK
jgi:hypothetical protein